MVSVQVIDAHHYRVHASGGFKRIRNPICGCLRHDHGAIADAELRAMVADPKMQCEAERIAEPVRGLLYILIPEFRYDGACRHRTVLSHESPLLFPGGS
jgi:hypothetical protein